MYFWRERMLSYLRLKKKNALLSPEKNCTENKLFFHQNNRLKAYQTKKRRKISANLPKRILFHYFQNETLEIGHLNPNKNLSDINGSTAEKLFKKLGFYSVKKRWRRADIIPLNNLELRMKIKNFENDLKTI